MNTDQSLTADERTVTLLRANTWGYNFIVFGLLIDIMYRSLIFHEAAWDLFALLGVAGAIGIVYATRHRVRVFGWNSAVIIAIGALVAAVVAAILAITKTI